MPWIKAEISDDAHKAYKHRSVDEDRNLSDVIADVLEAHANE